MYAILHPDVERDLRRLFIRQLWQDSYRAFRKSAENKELTPLQIIEEYQPSDLAYNLSRLWGIEFKEDNNAGR